MSTKRCLPRIHGTHAGPAVIEGVSCRGVCYDPCAYGRCTALRTTAPHRVGGQGQRLKDRLRKAWSWGCRTVLCAE
jgi:hypothetical protein